jgi:putative MFS transporter
MNAAAAQPSSANSIVSRIERLPAGWGLMRIVLLIAIGGWFEFYELFMPGGIASGLVHSGIYRIKANGLLDFHSFPSFLAAFFLGMFLSTLLFSRLSDVLGRRLIFIWAMAAYSIFNVFIACSSSPEWIDFFRLCAGFGVGVQLINNDSFLSEILPGRLRGRYMTIAMVLILTATPLAVLVGTAFTPHQPLGMAGWRWVVLVGALGGIVVWFIQRGIPESPRWLAAHGRLKEADMAMRQFEAAIERVHGKLPAAVPYDGVVTAERRHWSEIFSPFYIKRTFALSVLQFCQTIAVFGFGSWVPILLVERGYSVVHSLAYTTVILLSAPVGGLLGVYFAERFERKWQLVFTAIGIAVFGFAFAFAPTLPLIVISGLLYTLSNNWLIAVFHPYAAELFPTRIRAQAIGFTFCWSRVSAIFVGYWVSAILAAEGQTGVFVMVGAAMLAIVLAIGIFGPRTNGLQLETLAP